MSLGSPLNDYVRVCMHSNTREFRGGGGGNGRVGDVCIWGEGEMDGEYYSKRTITALVANSSGLISSEDQPILLCLDIAGSRGAECMPRSFNETLPSLQRGKVSPVFLLVNDANVL